MRNALLHANSSDDRVVYIPSGHMYAMMPMNVSDIHNVSLQIDGLIEVSEDNVNWPLKD